MKTIIKRLERFIKELWKDKTFRRVITIFIIAKILVITTGFLAHYLIPVESTNRQIRSDNIFLNPWAQYDAGAYLDIAENGYNMEYNGTGNYSWYPLYPLMIIMLGFLGYPLAAFLISNVFSLLAIIVLYLLIKKEFGPEITEKTVFYLLLFPTAYFFTAMYTESLFLFLAVAMFYFARQDKWLLVGTLGFMISLSRMQGALLFIPMLYMYLSTKKEMYHLVNLSQ